MRADDIPAVSPDYTVVDLDDRFLIIPRRGAPSSARPAVVKGSGHAMLRMVDGHRTVREIAEAMISEHPEARDRIGSDAESLFSELEGIGLLFRVVPRGMVPDPRRGPASTPYILS